MNAYFGSALLAVSFVLVVPTSSAIAAQTPPKQPTTKAACLATDWSKVPADSKDDWYSNCQIVILAGDPKHGAEQTNVPTRNPAVAA